MVVPLRSTSSQCFTRRLGLIPRTRGRSYRRLTLSTISRASVNETKSLSELIAFESAVPQVLNLEPEGSRGDPTLRAQELLSRASNALAAARELIGDSDEATAAPWTPGGDPGRRASSSRNAEALDSARTVLRSSLEGGGPKSPQAAAAAGPPRVGPPEGAAPPRSGGAPAASTSQQPGDRGGDGDGGPGSARPSWADSLFGQGGGGNSGGSGGEASASRFLQMKSQGQAATPPGLDFAEPGFSHMAFLDLTSQADLDVQRARMAELPPLQSVLELTSASRPPSRQSEATESSSALSAPTATGQMLADGSGVLGDGTLWQKRSGEEFGVDGYWKRWTQLVGMSKDGTVSWEECWWETSDHKGLRELGAAKKGTGADGAAWNEAWLEKMYHDINTNEKMVERTAHKWARDEAADEWEEQWGEKYSERGPASKWADKWARQAENVWHERWGEDYDGGGGCVKYTNKWAERLGAEGEAPEQWGDKWTESFKDGRGSKHGEVWTAGRSGERYNRWWNEEHFGNGSVRKYGNSTGGEYWDNVEQMDTYYNPIPHFGYDLAVKHSPDLVNIPLRRPNQGPKQGQGGGSKQRGAGSGVDYEDDGGLGSGLDAL